MSKLTDSVAWQALIQHKVDVCRQSLSEVILSDPERLENCHLQNGSLRLNYAFQYATSQTIKLLCDLAHQQKLEEARDHMWRGDKINTTENRAALHVALRHTGDGLFRVDGRDVSQDVKLVRQKMADFANQIRSGQWKGATGKPIKHVINIGIGGSDLGPRMVVHALATYADGPACFFVSNADAYDLHSKLKGLDPAETLFVVVSKTFTTLETLMNAQSAREWIIKNLGEAAVAQHFVAVSTNLPAVEKFGITAASCFPLWDWVGGRFSLWSAVGLTIMLALGPERFDALCAGAAQMDEHFKNTPLDKNIPVVLALLGIWQRNFLGTSSLGILPYSERLAELPAYMQQLDMESNGKSITKTGRAVDYETAPLIFGERGTVGQHSFHQWLHQGTDKAAADFIGIAEDDVGQPNNHNVVLSNMVAQAGAFAFGCTSGAMPQDRYEGGRSSNLIILSKLDPWNLGQLIALYEHKIFVQGILWEINSFDQPGVELGKKVAKSLAAGEIPSGKENLFISHVLQSLHSRTL